MTPEHHQRVHIILNIVGYRQKRNVTQKWGKFMSEDHRHLGIVVIKFVRKLVEDEQHSPTISSISRVSNIDSISQAQGQQTQRLINMYRTESSAEISITS